MFQENNDEEVVDSAETTTEELEDNSTEDESTGEDEVEETTKGSKQSTTETPEARRARIKRQYEREFGKSDDKSTKENSGESNKEVNGDERYTRLELKTEGITSKKAQDIVIEYAQYKGIEVTAALKSPIVRAEIAELEKKTSAPAPSSRTNGGASNTFEYWVGQAKKGNFPRGDKEMMKKLQKARLVK